MAGSDLLVAVAKLQGMWILLAEMFLITLTATVTKTTQEVRSFETS